MAVLNISANDFQAGLIYIAYSRIKTLYSIIFDVPFNLFALRIGFDRLFYIRIEDERRRFLKRLPIPPLPILE